MTQIDRHGSATVPNLDARDVARLSGPGPLARLLAQGPIAIVFTGVLATGLWAGFIGWCLFSAVSWFLS